jgi:hypothetical protein
MPAGVEGSTGPRGCLHPVGKPWPWPAQEPRWCRLLPTAWLSGFPSGLTSSLLHPHPPWSPGSQGDHWQNWPSVLKSLIGLSWSLPHTLQTRLPQGEQEGSLHLPKVSLPLGLSGDDKPHSLSCHRAWSFHSCCSIRALGMGCCFCSWAGAEQQRAGVLDTGV